MKKKLFYILGFFLFLTANRLLAQTDVIYQFDSTQPLDGIEQLSGSVEATSIADLTDNGVANNTKVLRPVTVGSPNATGVINLNSFPSSADYSVTWKEYLNQANTTYKKGVLLRGNLAGGYTTGIKRGYYFMVQNNSTTGSVNFRILNSSASSISDLKNSGAVTISGFAIKKACWFRAAITDNVLTFSYSMDGTTFTTGTTYTDIANLYPSAGTTQLVFGIGSGSGQYYYDDIKFKSTNKQNSSITITGATSFPYNGSSLGPKTSSITGSTGTVSYSYSGTGTTVYGPSVYAPILTGTYQAIATVASDENYYTAVSSPFAFTITDNPSIPEATMRRPLSPNTPMWLIHIDVWAHQPQQVIDLIPEDIRPFVVMNLSMSTSILGDQGYNCAESWLNTCAQNGIWAMVQPSSGIQNAFAADTALTLYESLYKKYPNFIGYNFAEQSWGFDNTTFNSRLNLFVNLLKLGKKYGGYLYINDCFSISNANVNSIAKLKTNTEFSNATRVYKDHMIYGDKFTNSYGYYDNESGALGAFLSGHAGNYAIRYDQYSWNFSGRGKVFGQEEASDRNPDGNRSIFACPEAVMGIPIVEHMMLTGATVIDGPEIPWMSVNYGPYLLPPFKNMLADIYRKVLDGSIRIPTVNEVAARTKLAFVNDMDYNTSDSLFSNLYAMDGSLMKNRTWLKKSGRYASIPQLFSDDAYETSLFSGATFVKKSAYSTRWPNEQAKVNEFNTLYPVEAKGDMFVSRVKNSLYCYNPWINTDKETSASIPLKYNTCDSIALSYPAHTFSVINEEQGKLKVYLNNYRTDKNQFWDQYPDDMSWYALQNTILPAFATNPTDGTLRTSIIKVYGSTAQPSFVLTERGSHQPSTATTTWLNGVFTLSITHNGPVDISIDCEGNGTGKLTVPSPQNIISPAMAPLYAGEKEYEAEGAIITSPASNSNSIKKYHGTGYVAFSSNSSPTSAVKFNIINVGTTSAYDLQTRYTAVNASVNNVDLFVNGIKISTPTFQSTPTDSTWTIHHENIILNQGANTIEYKANAAGLLINFDKIILTEVDAPFSFASVDAVQKNDTQIQINWSVLGEKKLLRYELEKSSDGLNFSKIYTANANNTGSSSYLKIDGDLNELSNFYRVKSIDSTGVETFSQTVKVDLKTMVMIQAESGTLGTDWDILSDQGINYVSSKTDLVNSSFPGNDTKVITYNVVFDKPGTYDLYAKIKIGPSSANDDSFYYGSSFGTKNPLNDNGNSWITCNNLGGKGYTNQNDIVDNGGTTGNGVWKWINLSKFNGGETPVKFTVPQQTLEQIFQIGGREDGIQFDKFVFGASDQSFTVKELDSLIDFKEALPIKLLYFTRKTSGSSVQLNWATSNETNNKLFELYHGTDKDNFSKINQQSAISPNGAKYGYTHSNLSSGYHYYKLRQVDNDGNYEEFGPLVAKVALSENDFNAVVEENAIIVTLTSKENVTQTKLLLSDINGKTIYQSNVNLKQGINQFEFPVIILPGVYLLQINGTNVRLSKKLLKY